jgi:PIN domain nuclease of toxin-antitoxin system
MTGRPARRAASPHVRERVATASPLLLDTHVWLWWLDGRRHWSRRTDRALHDAQHEGRLHVSDFSLWEVAIKAGRGSLQLRLPLREWVARARRAPGLHYRPITADDLVAAHELPETPFRDPIDRALVAIARTDGMMLVTADRAIRSWAARARVALLDAAP